MTRKWFKSVLRVVPPVILLCLLLTGCECKHEWQSATCDTPKTCSRCQVTEGEALGHTWADATCKAPKTCSACGLTEGNSLAHTWVDATCATPRTCSACNATEGEAPGHTWTDATCKAPKTCSVCNATEGEAAEHKWVTDTCTISNYCSVCFQYTGDPPGHTWTEATTEAPKTCTKCGKTEGSKIHADPRFSTSVCKPLFGTWTGIIKLSGSKLVGEGCTGTLELDYTITFTNNGNYQETIQVKNQAQFTENAETYYIDMLYKDLSAQGYNQTQADEAMKAAYGMDVKTYANKLASSINYNAFAADTKGVYFITDNKLYTGSKWTVGRPDDFKISGNTLTIDSLSKEFPDLVLTKS